MSGSASGATLGAFWTLSVLLLWLIVIITLLVSCVYYWRLWRSPVPDQAISTTQAATMFGIQVIIFVVLLFYVIITGYRMTQNVVQAAPLASNSLVGKIVEGRNVASGIPYQKM